MKALLASLIAAVALALVVPASGCILDLATAFAIAFASTLTGLCVADYSRQPSVRRAPVGAARIVRPTRSRRPRTAAGFATVIVYETTCDQGPAAGRCNLWRGVR